METLFYRYNTWWENVFELENIIERADILTLLKKQLATKQVVFLTGLRRVGKTTALKLFIKHLITKEEIDPRYIFYISMDDYLLSKNTILEIVEEYRKIQKISFKKKVFLFFDEITYKPDYELQLKNLYDSQQVKIYASSSSASVLRSKKSYLTGRNTIMEILPLDFDEYLKFKKISISKGDAHLREKYFEEYLNTGGLPEYVLHGNIEYLKELVDDIIYKDIIAMHNIREHQVLKDFFILLMERAGKMASINKIAHILNISPDTAKRYLQMFVDAYLIYLVPRYGKTNEKLLAPKKIYAADLGIRVLFTGFRDKGSLFENYLYFKIKNRVPCYLYEDGVEIDFLTKDNTLIEIKYEGEMSAKQNRLFENFKADKKIIIKNIHDLDEFLSVHLKKLDAII